MLAPILIFFPLLAQFCLSRNYLSSKVVQVRKLNGSLFSTNCLKVQFLDTSRHFKILFYRFIMRDNKK